MTVLLYKVRMSIETSRGREAYVMKCIGNTPADAVSRAKRELEAKGYTVRGGYAVGVWEFTVQSANPVR